MSPPGTLPLGAGLALPRGPRPRTGWWPVDKGEIAYEPEVDPVEPLAVAEIDGTESRHAVVIDRKGRCLHDPGGEGVVKPGSTTRVYAVIGIVPGPSSVPVLPARATAGPRRRGSGRGRSLVRRSAPACAPTE